MLTTYLKIAWRNLFKNKLHTAINTGGLMIGFTIGLVILLLVYSQYQFDVFHANGKRIYEVYQSIQSRDKGEEVISALGYGPGPVYKTAAAAIEKMTRITDGGNHVEYNGKELVMPVMMADEDFFPMFSFDIVQGNRQNPLQRLTDAVITEEAAKKIFGNADPIGKTIHASAGDKLKAYTIAAVIKTMRLSSINFELMTRIETRSNYAAANSNWNDRAPGMYVELKEGTDQQTAEAQLRSLDAKYVPDWFSDPRATVTTQLLPLKDVHFSTRVNGHKAISSIQLLTVLMVGLFIIFIACFNFVNINLATAFTRIKEIGVRKCMGAARWKLFVQFWGESLLVCCLSFFISLLLVNILLHSVQAFEPFRVALLSVLWQPGFLLVAGGLLLLVSLMAGGYPSWVMVRFRLTESLKGKASMKQKSGLRSSLIVMQFVIACVMISATWIIYRQFQYLQNADLGINQNNIISVRLNKPEKGRGSIEKLRNGLASNPDIVSVTGSDINIGKGPDRRTSKTTSNIGYDGKTITTNMAAIDYDYCKTFAVKMLEGRDFDKSFGTDTMNNVLVSESVAKQINEKNIIGKTIGADSGSRGMTIVGVFADFHLYTMEEELEPLTLTMSPQSQLGYVFIKTNGRHPVASMEAIKKQMASLEPGQDFSGSFVNDNIQNWYQQEKIMAILFSIAAGVAIVLSCSGLLAMVLLIIQQRVKEIGVRKVLGATVQNIALLISKDFLALVLIAVIIATPLSWLMMNKWLQAFPYRTSIAPWMYGVVAIAAILIALVTIGYSTVRAGLQNP
ncbi:MAG TPA: FtsX-like permease family protein, partial [Chitinophagaceae bacterium]|nr:FtsX-like permease family protein [Chitinophagaceae bacterium]